MNRKRLSRRNAMVLGCIALFLIGAAFWLSHRMTESMVKMNVFKYAGIVHGVVSNLEKQGKTPMHLEEELAKQPDLKSECTTEVFQYDGREANTLFIARPGELSGRGEIVILTNKVVVWVDRNGVKKVIIDEQGKYVISSSTIR